MTGVLATRTAVCGVCGTSAPIEKVNGIEPVLPPGWAVLALSTVPLLHRTLCPAEVTAVRALVRAP